MNIAEIKSGFRELALDDRLRLLHELWDEVASDESVLELSPEEQVELERRFAAHEASPSSSRTWAEVHRDIRAGH